MSGLPGLKNARKSKGFTQSQLAAVVGCHEMTIRRLENGKSNARYALITKLANVLETSERELLFPDSEANTNVS